MVPEADVLNSIAYMGSHSHVATPAANTLIFSLSTARVAVYCWSSHSMEFAIPPYPQNIIQAESP